MTRHSETVTAYFDAQARRYRARFSAGPLGALRQRERTALFDLLDPRPGDHILDAGCGAGNDALVLLARGARVSGLDASPEMVAAARASGIDAALGDLHDFDLGRRFDKVLCAGPLEFCEDPPRAMARLAAHVAPGGRLVLLFPTRANGGRLYRLYHRMNGFSIRLFSMGEMLGMVSAAGLVGRRCERPASFSMALSAERDEVA
jgi:SAM-dependent methyltransferase